MSEKPRPKPEASLTMLTKLVNNLQLVWRLLRDPRVPWGAKIIPGLTLIYVVSPIDLIPDVIPVLGQLDDLAVILLGLNYFVRVCPPEIVEEHRRALRGDAKPDDVVDAEYRVVDDTKK